MDMGRGMGKCREGGGRLPSLKAAPAKGGSTMERDMTDRVAYAIIVGICAFCLLLIAVEDLGWL